jgi:hypothetical protein
MHHARNGGIPAAPRDATAEQTVTGIEQQPHRLAGAGHQAVDVRRAFDHRAHVVMERHAHAERRHFRQFRHLRP